MNLGKGLLVVVVALASSVEAFGQPLNSCSEVATYLKSGDAERDESFAKITKLEKGIREITGQEATDQCGSPIVERALFEYAETLDKYARSFSNMDEQRTWAKRTANAYRDYVQWFAALDDTQQDRLITEVAGTRASSKKARDNWVRNRVGNALKCMGEAFVLAGTHEDALDAYETFFSGEVPTLFFITQVVHKWHYWLRAQADFLRVKNEQEIVVSLTTCERCRARWETFLSFLNVFAEANPSVRTQWIAVRERIGQWLS